MVSARELGYEPSEKTHLNKINTSFETLNINVCIFAFFLDNSENNTKELPTNEFYPLPVFCCFYFPLNANDRTRVTRTSSRKCRELAKKQLDWHNSTIFCIAKISFVFHEAKTKMTKLVFHHSMQK